jgi:hypothetical protein
MNLIGLNTCWWIVTKLQFAKRWVKIIYLLFKNFNELLKIRIWIKSSLWSLALATKGKTFRDLSLCSEEDWAMEEILTRPIKKRINNRMSYIFFFIPAKSVPAAAVIQMGFMEEKSWIKRWNSEEKGLFK